MEELKILIEQMVTDITSQAVRLNDVRLQKFLEYLKSHSSIVKTAQQIHIEVTVHDRLRNGLQHWFEVLPMQGLLWEYRLILDEINWWHDFDPHSLPKEQRDTVTEISKSERMD